MYSVFDLETTGFAPSHGDRILEIGIVKINEENRIVDQYSTLVNPNRDISNAHIHGIKPNLVKNAPRFDEIRDFLKMYLKDSVLVAHNAPFDLRFLESELMVGNNKLKGICTINLSRRLNTHLPSRKLEGLCEFYDVELNDAHQALADARATAQLFSKMKEDYCKTYGFDSFRREFVNPITFDINDSFRPKRVEYPRISAQKDVQNARSKLSKLISRLPTEDLSEDKSELRYMDTLNEVLSDRIITDSELNELENLINEFGLSQEQIYQLHEQYITELIKVYLLDGIISEFELNDLTKVGRLLGLDSSRLNKLITDVKNKKTDYPGKEYAKDKVNGHSICFTGQLQSKIDGVQVGRSMAQKIAQQHGMIIKKNVSKKLDYLVVADPNTMSGKAKKARKYGITIWAEPEFWVKLGINVE